MLAPVTRSHPVVASPPPAAPEPEPEPPSEPLPELVNPAQNGAVAHSHDSTPDDSDDDVADATQEYLIAHDEPLAGDSWLEDDEDS